MPLPGLTLLVASIGFADSINPSTVVPALYIAGTPRARGLASYALGVFVVYLAGGLVLVLGPGPALISALHHTGPRFEHGVEAVVGAGALVAAALLWRAARKPADEAKPPRSVTAASAFALGAGITALELPTAFPYFGAVSAILGADSGAPTRIALVLAYNVLFVLPLVLVFALRNRIEPRIAAILLWLRRVAPLALAAVVGVGGALLLALGAAGLLTA